jgi:hypothetical protein
MNGPGPSELRLDMRLRENHYRAYPSFVRMSQSNDLIAQHHCSPHEILHMRYGCLGEIVVSPKDFQ